MANGNHGTGFDGRSIRALLWVASFVAVGCDAPPPPDACRCAGPVDDLGTIDIACGTSTCLSGNGVRCVGPNAIERDPTACASTGDAAMGGDGGSDAGPPAPRLFARCTVSSQCDAGLRCDTGFPSGFCTRDCARDADCGASGVCTLDGCAPRCRSGAEECDVYGGACAVYTDAAFCVPTCNTRFADSMCTGALVCDEYRGDCTTSPVTAGADIGAACTGDADCRSGFCITEIIDGQPTGFLGGTCAGTARSLGLGIIPQRAGCPDGTTATMGNPVGDLTLCLDECSRDAQCRAGYFCDGAPGIGFCRPLACDRPSARRCPTGTSCEIVSGTSLCVRCVPECTGRSCGPDGCGGTCGTCPGALDQCTTAGTCACVGETDATLCSRMGADCGALTVTDGCGMTRSIDCGTCASGGTCGAVTPNRCCAPETDAVLCSAAGANCGSISVTDRCGGARTPSCGSCTSPSTCGAITANRCGCVAETAPELCASRGATCGTLSVTDRCGVGRSVSCGSCTLPETCAGAGTPNTCGICTPSCGAHVCGTDGCGGSCGSCPSGQRCNAGGACELIPCDPVHNTLCPTGQKCEWTGSTTACVPAGTGRAETPCLTRSDCAPEHTCTTEGFCREYCSSSSDCTDGLCALDATGSPYGLCSIPCDPTYAAWSAGAAGCTYDECRLLNSTRATEFPDCGDMGSGFDGASCALTSDCYAGRACISSHCRRVCVLATSCSTGACTSVPGWGTYGICP